MDSTEWYLHTVHSERKQCRSLCSQPCRNAAMPNESTNKVRLFFSFTSVRRRCVTCQTMVFFFCVSTSLTYRSYPANKNPLNVEMKYESSANDVIRFHLVRRRRRRRRPRGIHFRGKPFMESFSVACQREANFERILQINEFGWLLPYGPIRKIWCSWEQTNWLKYSWAKLSSSASRQNHVSVSITYYIGPYFAATTRYVERQPNGSFAAAQEPNKWKKRTSTSWLVVTQYAKC